MPIGGSLVGAVEAGVGVGGLVVSETGDLTGTGGEGDGTGGRGMSSRLALGLVSVGNGGRGISGLAVPDLPEEFKN